MNKLGNGSLSLVKLKLVFLGRSVLFILKERVDEFNQLVDHFWLAQGVVVLEH